MIIVSLILGILSGLFNPMVGICTIVTFMATSSIFAKSEDVISLFKNFTKRGVLKSIGIGVLVGSILGFINLFLNGSQQMSFSMNIKYFLISLNPGIFEEISFRLFMYAFCIYLLKGKISTNKEKVWCYIVMVIPHVLIHTPDMFYENGSLYLNPSIIVTVIILALLFGLPFALLQRKRDLYSAMIAHGLVDFIRFCFFGLPI